MVAYGQRENGETQAVSRSENGASRGSRPSLAVLLKEAGLVPTERVQAALMEGMQTGEKLGEVLIRQGAVSEEQLAQLLAKQWDLPFVKADSLTVDPFALRRLPASDARELGGLPVRFEQSDSSDGEPRLMVAIAEPSEERFAAISEAVGTTDVCYEVVAHSTLERLLRSRLTGSSEGDEAAQSESQPEPVEAREEHAAEAHHEPEAQHEPVVAEARAAIEESQPEPQSESHSDAHPDLRPVSDLLEDAAEQLRTTQSEVDALVSSLRRAERRIEEYEVKLEEAERDREKLRKLEEELERRERHFDALREKVGELNEALASG
jgi:type IV pilus assembly protein PilB